MKLLTALTAATSLVTSAYATGRAIIQNKCPYDLYVWSVGVSGPTGPNYVPANTGGYSENWHYDGGIALKACRRSDGLYTAAPEFIFAYTLDGRSVWYDTSIVFGNPVSANTALAPADKSCPGYTWSNGQQPPDKAPHKCGADKDIYLTFCS